MFTTINKLISYGKNSENLMCIKFARLQLSVRCNLFYETMVPYFTFVLRVFRDGWAG